VAASVRGDWHTWLLCQVFRREAEALIQGKAAEPKKLHQPDVPAKD
jgi:hypothetical protein